MVKWTYFGSIFEAHFTQGDQYLRQYLPRLLTSVTNMCFMTSLQTEKVHDTGSVLLLQVVLITVVTAGQVEVVNVTSAMMVLD